METSHPRPFERKQRLQTQPLSLACTFRCWGCQSLKNNINTKSLRTRVCTGAGIPGICTPAGLASDVPPVGPALDGIFFSDRRLLGITQAFEHVLPLPTLSPYYFNNH